VSLTDTKASKLLGINSAIQQALKKAILHRENAYFYKTEKGAQVGDLFTSLIHTCELNSVNPLGNRHVKGTHVGKKKSASKMDPP
jgi:hypothetical protein